tara:strand:- start:1707 stop:1964 length:258 start_codon:yes stop_codon:yes gene_type:complete
MWSLEEDAEFKIGDLVRIKEPVDFLIYELIVKPGDVGLVVDIDVDQEILSVWGIDYIVLIHGRTLVFFAEELELVTQEEKENTVI